MFGKSKELAERISQLEKELELEKTGRAKAEAALTEFIEQRDMNTRVFEEMRTAVESRLKELDNRTADFENFKNDEKKKLEEEKCRTIEEIKQKALVEQELLQQKMEESKKERERELEERIEAFKQNINSYLLDFQNTVGSLTAALVGAGSDIFSDGAKEISESIQPQAEAEKPSIPTSAEEKEMPEIKQTQLERILKLYEKPNENKDTPRDAQ